jgi:tRNA-2-methylthio-N6-dimethylallyladenosine synthase
VVLFNTCSVREQAENKVYSRLGELKGKRPGLIVGVLGCMAERDGEGLVRRMPQVDLMCGPGELDKVPQLIDNAVKTAAPQVALQGNSSRRTGTLAAAEDQLELLDLSRSFDPDQHHGSAYVRITRGCNKFCTYCVVPFTRGAEVHRPPDHIVDECRRLADAGVIEVTLLGQTVNHYRYDHGAAVYVGGVEQPQKGPGLAAFKQPDHQLNVGRRVTTFADLLRRIHDEAPAIRRLRFVTSYPRDFGDDILRVMADSPRICNYLHVPAQSGSDRMLKAMNREYTAGEYLEFIDRVYDHMPEAMLASDFIVGFPGETEADFEQTVELVRRCRFKNSFIFKYSPRPGTVAIDRFVDDVPEADKRRRNNHLLAVQHEISREIHEAQVGRTVDVLVEGASRYTRKGRPATASGGVELRIAGRGTEAAANPSGMTETATPEMMQLSGRTDGDLITMFDAPADRVDALVGRIVPVTITHAKPLTLFGRLA